MSVAIDIIAIVIIAVCVIVGYKRGLVRSVMNFASFIVALFAAWRFSPALSSYLQTTVYMNRISDTITKAIDSLLTAGSEKFNLDSLFNDKPSAFTSIIEQYGGSVAATEQYYSENSSDIADSGVGTLTKSISEFLAEPVAVSISNAVAFMLMFFGVLIILLLVAFILDLIFKLPVLRVANRLGGVALGIVCAGLYLSVICVILKAMIPPLSQMYPQSFSENITENSLLCRLFEIFNPVETLWNRIFSTTV